uniref:MHC class I-like antigen recognition-like domain-containing protein n=1 Tax=Bos taurus TaxID=9913 RepID=G5E6B9_BOVIN
MLFLQLPLAPVLLVGGDNEENKNSVPEDFQEPVSFEVICVLSFHNSSWVQSLGSGWLGELQTHCWKSNPGTIIYLWPWSKGNFSNEELMELQSFSHMSFIRFVQAFYSHARKWQFEYPFEVQIAKGCELQAGEAPVGFMRVAYQGSDFLSFQNKSWVSSPEGGRRAQVLRRLFNLFQETQLIIHKLLSDTCPHFLLGLLDARKAYLQRQDHHSSVSWIALAVSVTLVLMAGLAFWLWKHWTHHESPSSILPLE